MSRVLKKFISILEKKIALLTKEIDKQRESINIESYTNLFTEENIWNLTKEDLDNLLKFDVLNEEEQEFFTELVEFDEDIKNYFKKCKLSDHQKGIILNSKEKIQNAKNSDDIKELEQYLQTLKRLMLKLRNNDLNVIDESEINIIFEFLKNSDLSMEEKMNLFYTINSLNINIFNNHNIKIEEEILSEDSLEETNIDSILLEELLKKYDIKLLLDDNIMNTENKVKKNILLEYKNKLIKYGNIEKIEEILEFLSEKNLTFVYGQPEILTKTLLFSSVEKLKQVIQVSEENGIDYEILLRNQSSIFFPTIRESKISKKGNGTSATSINTTGSLNNYIDNVNFLKKNGFEPSEIFKACEVFFIRNAATNEKIYNKLCMYGLSFRFPDGTARSGFSCLNTLNVLDKLDIAIECGCYDYYQDNLSKLIDSNLNLYRIKYVREKFNATDQQIFKTIKGKNNQQKICLPAVFSSATDETYGQTAEDTFKMYEAVRQSNYYLQLYQNILENNDNDTISEIVLNDDIIKELDSKYKTSDLIYNFDGVIISRYKVLRHYQTLISSPKVEITKDAIMYVITMFSMLNFEELTKIRNCVGNINYKRRILN